MFQSAIPIPPKSFKDTPFTWVATPQDFRSMLFSLRKVAEIAVDLEHHNYRSFAGFLCLMQISSREEDWVIDTLSLREEMTELNEIFTNPKIVKVGVCSQGFSEILMAFRSFMVLIMISFGYSKTLAYLSSTYSTLTMPLNF